jgi:hypothetical protein
LTDSRIFGKLIVARCFKHPYRRCAMAVTNVNFDKNVIVPLDTSETQKATNAMVGGHNRKVVANNDDDFFDTHERDGMLVRTFTLPQNVDVESTAKALVERVKLEAKGRDAVIVRIDNPQDPTHPQLAVVWADELKSDKGTLERGERFSFQMPDGNGGIRTVNGTIEGTRKEDEDGFWTKAFNIFRAALEVAGGIFLISAAIGSASLVGVMIAGGFGAALLLDVAFGIPMLVKDAKTDSKPVSLLPGLNQPDNIALNQKPATLSDLDVEINKA